jgi:RNase adaptor protein for sRNA GlmZ degradation
MQIEVMIDEAVSKNLHLGKTRDEIIMSYQSEETIVEFSDDEEHFIDTNQIELQTIRTELEQALQTEKEKTKTLESRLAFLETAVASLIS